MMWRQASKLNVWDSLATWRSHWTSFAIPLCRIQRGGFRFVVFGLAASIVLDDGDAAPRYLREDGLGVGIEVRAIRVLERVKDDGAVLWCVIRMALGASRPR